MVDDWRAQKGFVLFLTDAGKKLEVGVGFGVFEVDRFFASSDQANQACPSAPLLRPSVAIRIQRLDGGS
jgi:hypothetical protein